MYTVHPTLSPVQINLRFIEILFCVGLLPNLRDAVPHK